MAFIPEVPHKATDPPVPNCLALHPHKLSGLKKTHIYYPIVHMSLESGHSLAWSSFRVSHEAAFKVSARLGDSSDGSTGEGSASKFTYMVVYRIQFIWAVGLRASVSYPLLVKGHPQFPAVRASPTRQVGSLNPTRETAC